MTTTQTNIENTIVAFHIGRGGRFYNPGHLSFVGIKGIDAFTEDLYLRFSNSYKIAECIGDRPRLNDLYDAMCSGDAKAIARMEAIGFDLGELVYFDSNGNTVGLTYAESLTGIGRIDQDGEYDTTYTCLLSDCGDNELQAIIDNGTYPELVEYLCN